MKLVNTLFAVLLFSLLRPTWANVIPSWATNQYITFEWCEVRGDYGLCDFALEGVVPVYDHVRWGTGNYTLNGYVSGAFTPRIIKKNNDYQTAIGYVKSVDTLRDVFHCQAVAQGAHWDRRCDFSTVPGSLFGTANIAGVRGSGITRRRGAAMSRYMPNGACVPMYLTEYEVLDTSVSPPRVKEVVSMPARRARIMNQCVLVYTEFF